MTLLLAKSANNDQEKTKRFTENVDENEIHIEKSTSGNDSNNNDYTSDDDEICTSSNIESAMNGKEENEIVKTENTSNTGNSEINDLDSSKDRNSDENGAKKINSDSKLNVLERKISSRFRLNNENIEKWLQKHGIHHRLRSFSTTPFQTNSQLPVINENYYLAHNKDLGRKGRNSLPNIPKKHLPDAAVIENETENKLPNSLNRRRASEGTTRSVRFIDMNVVVKKKLSTLMSVQVRNIENESNDTAVTEDQLETKKPAKKVTVQMVLKRFSLHEKHSKDKSRRTSSSISTDLKCLESNPSQEVIIHCCYFISLQSALINITKITIIVVKDNCGIFIIWLPGPSSPV